MYWSIGAGMNRRPPRSALLYLVVQTQGIVGIVAGSVAAAFGGLAAAPAGGGVAWVVAALVFAATVAALFSHWQRSLATLRAAIRPIHPTPPGEMDAPF
jgi:hypothetical protein